MRKFLITLIVLAVLLVAADFGGRVYAESRAASAIQTELGLTSTPDVSIEGFPFLVHAVQGEYPQVIVTANQLDQGLLPGTKAVLNLFDVTMPLRDALAGDTSHLTANSTTLQVLIPLSSVQAAIARPDLTLSAAPDGGLMVSTTVSALGQQIPVSGVATLSVTGDSLTLTVGSLTAAGVDLTDILKSAVQALAGSLTTTIPLGALPFSVTDADVAVTASDIALTVSTGPVTLNDLR